MHDSRFVRTASRGLWLLIVLGLAAATGFSLTGNGHRLVAGAPHYGDDAAMLDILITGSIR